MSMRRVIIESPLSSSNGYTVESNKDYARKCVLDCLRRGESPLAGHLLYTQVLDDLKPEERAHGMAAGFAWYGSSDAVIVYNDRGISSGMRAGIELAKRLGVPVELRHLDVVQAPGFEGE